MIRRYLPLNGLRAFEAAARHASLTKAAIELNVTPAALGHQVKALEERLGAPLFHRLPRGLALTDEGQALLPVLRDSFDRMAAALAPFDERGGRDRRWPGSRAGRLRRCCRRGTWFGCLGRCPPRGRFHVDARGARWAVNRRRR